MHFRNPDFCINEFHIPKALFCSNINAVLQILFELQGWIAREAIHITFVHIPMSINVTHVYLHKHNLWILYYTELGQRPIYSA